jgi:hypothetical protein
LRTVFISHSANGDSFAGDVLERLSDVLESRKYEVWVDRSGLRSGREWEDQLQVWAGSCDAAVVLLNVKALNSDWVRDEVTILLHRRHMLGRRRGQGPFVLPVLIGGVRPRDVRSTGLRKLTKLHLLDGSAELDAHALAERVVGHFASPGLDGEPAETGGKAMDEWVERIAYRIGQVASESRLAEAARALEMSDDEVATIRLWDGTRFLAHRLMDDRLCRRAVHAVGKLTPFMPVDDGRKLVHEMAPTWVDGEAAALMLPEPSDDRLVALLNACRPETGEEYFARATCRAITGYWSRIVGIAVGHQPVAELLTAWERALESDFVIGHPDDQQAPPFRCFLIVDPNGVNLEFIADAIRTMNERYPWLGILLLTGGSLPDDATVRSWRLRNPVLLRPALDDRAEFTARQTVRDLVNLTT